MADPSETEPTDPRVLTARFRHEQGLNQRRADIAQLQTGGYSVLPSTFNTAGIPLDTGPMGVDRAFPTTVLETKPPNGVDDVWTSDA